MQRFSLTPAGVCTAALLAGPIFVAAFGLAQYVANIPRPIAAPAAGMVIEALPTLVPVIIAGILLSIIPIALGALLMAAVGDRFEWARAPETWLAAGAAAGWGITRLFNAEGPATTFTLIATSAACAWICRLNMLVE